VYQAYIRADANPFALCYPVPVLVLGVGMSQSNTSCALGIFSCIGQSTVIVRILVEPGLIWDARLVAVFYALSKIFIYLFLIEKVHIVGNTNLPRLKSKLYILCMVGMLPYLLVLVLMIIGRSLSCAFDHPPQPTDLRLPCL
jgi:hypothetical protein